MSDDQQQTISATITNTATGEDNDVIVNMADGTVVSSEPMSESATGFFDALRGVMEMVNEANETEEKTDGTDI